MKLPEVRALGTPVTWLQSAESTNLSLRLLWEADHDLSSETLIITDEQTRGRGRQGRGWETPQGKALAVSILVRGFRGLELSWLPLIAGSAVVRALEPFFPPRSDRMGQRPVVKWPNDVHLQAPSQPLGKKLSGILCELLPDGSVIIGVGMNLFLESHELPTERAGSLLTEGAIFDSQTLEPGIMLDDTRGAQLADNYLVQFVTELRSLVMLSESDPERVREIITGDSATIGSQVRVVLPNDQTVTGTAVRYETDGALVVQQRSGEMLTMHAADVEHVREV